MAAEITRDLIITEDALKAPLDFAANWGVTEKSLDDVIAKLMQFETTVSKSNSTPKLKKETEGLTAAQKELGKIQNQIVTVQAKNNAEYIKEVKVLNEVKKAIKEKTILGERDAKTVNAQNSSIPILSAALAKNRAAYDALTDAEARNSKEGQELLGIINQQDQGLKTLKKSYGQSQLEVGNYEGALKDLKLQLKDSKDELIGIARTLGVDSKEFQEAAARAGELNNEVGDLQATVKAVSGSKFENIASSLGLVGTKLKTLDFKGAASAANQLLGATKALTFKEAISGAGEFGKTMLRVGASLLINPIFLIAAAVVGIGLAVNKLKDNIPFLTKAFELLGNGISFVTQMGKDFLDFVGLTTFALDDQTKKVVDAANKQREALSDKYDEEIKLLEAAGKSTVEAEKAKQKAILQTSFTAAKALQNQRKNSNTKFSEEQQKELDELVKINKQASVELKAIKLREGVELAKIAEDNAKKIKEARLRELGDAFKLSQFLVQNSIDAQKQILDNEKKSFEERMDAGQDLVKLRTQMAIMERDNALKQENLTASGRKLIIEKFNQEVLDIEAQRREDQLKVRDSEAETQKEILAKRIEAQKAGIAKQAEEQQRAFEQEIQSFKEAQIAKGVASEEVDKQIAKKRKDLADDQINVQIEALRKTLMIEGLSADERAAIEKELYKLKNDLTNAYYDNLENREQTALEKAKSFIEKYGQAFSELFASLGELANSFTEQRLQKLQLEQEASDERREGELDAEEEKTAALLENEDLTAEQKDAIEANSDKKKKAIEESAEKREESIEARRKKAVRRQAQFDKAVALVIGGIKLAQAVVTMLTAGPPAGFALSALAAAIGAVQLAAIAAKPIPAAEHGIQGHKGGAIIAGEAGRELVEMPGNKFAFTGSKAALYNLPTGTNIYPADSEATIRALAISGLSPERGGRQMYGNEDIKKELRDISKTIRNKKEVTVVGRVSGYVQNGNRVNYLDSWRNRA